MYFCATVPNTKQAKHICEQPQLCICVNNSLQRKKLKQDFKRQIKKGTGARCSESNRISLTWLI